MCTVWIPPLILLVSEMLEIPRANVEAHFLKKLAFCNQQMFDTTERLLKYTVVHE